MSQISKALQKIAESRQKQQESKAGGIVYLTDAPKTWPKTALMVLLAAGTLGAVSISISAITMTMRNTESKQMQVLALEKTINSQEKRIDDFITAINKNQKFTDSQIRDLHSGLKEEDLDMKAQVSNLALTDSANYDSLKGSVLENKLQVDSLNQYTKTLDQKMEAMSAANTQAKDVTSPATGN